MMPGGDRNAFTQRERPLLRRIAYYLLPIVLIALVGSVGILEPFPVSREIVLLLLTLAVLISARIGGLGPGLFATILGTALEWKFSAPDNWSPALFAFLLAGVAVSLLTAPLRSAARQALDRQRRETLDALPKYTAILARDGIVSEVNRAALETAGLSREDVVGKPFDQAYWWSHSSEIQHRLKNAMAECAAGEPVHFEATLRQGADRFKPVELSFSLQGGWVIASAEDISRRVAAKRETDTLRERAERSESALVSAYKAADVAVFDWLVQQNEVAWSDELRVVFGLGQAGEQAEDWLTLVHPADRDSVEREIRRCLHSRLDEYRLAFHVTPASGGTRSLLSAGAIVYLPDKRQRLLGVVVDVTRNEQLEAAARDSEERYRLLMDNLPEIVFTARPDGRWDYASPAWARYTGLEGSQAADYGWSSGLHPEDVQGVLYRWMDAVRAGKPFNSEHRIRSADGEYRWFVVRAAPVRATDGRVAHWFGAVSDVDDQKRFELAAQSRQEWYERAHTAAGIGLFEWEVESGQLRCSDDWSRLYGIQSTAAMRLDDWIDSIYPDDRERVREELRRGCEESGCREFEYRIGAPETSLRWITTRVTVSVDDNGNPVCAVGASMDATERKRLEEVLRSKQRLESIGLLAGGIAHDFNNLLTGIIGNSSLLLEKLASVGPSIKDILRASDRAADLTRQMLAFAGKGLFQTELVNLSQIARDAAQSLESSLPKNIQFQLEITPDLAAIDADPNQVRLVLTTLIHNAIEAIGENNQGTISIATSVRNVASEDADIASGTYVCLEVRDTGCGMDEKTRRRVFDPFFTTKFQGRGLGLSAAMGIVRGHKGAIRVSSAPGQGSIFTALFPASIDAPVSKPQPATGEQLDRSAKILVVDDEDIVRNLAKTVLEREGYSVLLAESGDKALDQFGPRPDEIMLVLLDVSMPGLSSEETLKRLRAIRPEVKILLFSGYSAAEALRSFEGTAISGFLQKPFTAKALAGKVAEVIGGGSTDVGSLPTLLVPSPHDPAHNHYPA